MSNEKLLRENRDMYKKRLALQALQIPDFTLEESDDSTILAVDQPTNTFNQVILGEETLAKGSGAIKALFPKDRDFSLWSWGKRIQGLGRIEEMLAMVLQPDPWVPDPKVNGELIRCATKQHFQVAGELIARTMSAGEGTVIRNIFKSIDVETNTIKQPPNNGKVPHIMRFILSVEGRGASTIALAKHGDRGLIFDFATNPDFQGQGHGETMLKVAIRAAMNKGIWRLHLQAAQKAVSLYERTGFKSIGRVFETVGRIKG